MPLSREFPSFLNGNIVKLRTRISHGAIKIGEFTFYFKGHIQSLLHTFPRIIRKAENKITDNPYPEILDISHRRLDIPGLHSFNRAIPDYWICRLNTQGQPI